jgi:hypothetical protein
MEAGRVTHKENDRCHRQAQHISHFQVSCSHICHVPRHIVTWLDSTMAAELKIFIQIYFTTIYFTKILEKKGHLIGNLNFWLRILW